MTKRRHLEGKRAQQTSRQASLSQPRLRKQAQREFWVAIGIVVLIVLAFVLLYYYTVLRPVSQPTITDVTVLPPATTVATSMPTISANAVPESAGQPTSISGDKIMQWSQPPAMSIDTSKTYEAVLKTDKGDIRIHLYADKSPITVNNFVFLARQGFYDGVTFHRVISGFMAQTGDPTGTGRGGPGYKFANESDPTLKHDSEGIVAMANAGRDTNGSQFYITYAPQPHLDGGYTIFGKVIEGMDVLRSISPRNPALNGAPGDRIRTIEIIEK